MKTSSSASYCFSIHDTGAGETTTIRLLLGLHRATAGRAALFGADA